MSASSEVWSVAETGASRAPLDAPAGKRPAPEIVFHHLMEGIGLALDLKGDG
jgi:hypothetical protein